MEGFQPFLEEVALLAAGEFFRRISIRADFGQFQLLDILEDHVLEAMNGSWSDEVVVEEL